MQVEARVVADSISPQGVRITTIEGTIHRFVLAELNKHRLISQSAQSSRAVPVPKMLDMVRNDPMMPVFWGANQSGMSAKEECSNPIEMGPNAYLPREEFWHHAANQTAHLAQIFHEAGYHKQLVNRLIEWCLPQKVVLTATEWDNFYALRDHPDAQPEIAAFARCAKEAMDNSAPTRIYFHEWHMPYVTTVEEGYQTDGGEVTQDLEDAKRYSAARCATASYRTEKLSIERSLGIFEQLVTSDPWHSVPCEHVATPLEDGGDFDSDHLITHISRDMQAWSGNFRGWGQLRKEITGATLTK